MAAASPAAATDKPPPAAGADTGPEGTYPFRPAVGQEEAADYLLVLNADGTAEIEEQLVNWRRDIHMHPELGFQEARTAALIADTLGLGLSETVPGRNPLIDGFGLIAFASLFPIISVLGYAQLSALSSGKRSAEEN